MALLTDRRPFTVAIGGISTALLVTGGSWIWFSIRPVRQVPTNGVPAQREPGGREGEPGFQGGRGGFGWRRLNSVLEELELNARQRTQIATLQAAVRDSVGSPNEARSDAEREQRRHRVHTLVESGLQPILTPAQWAKYQTLRQRWVAPWQPGQGLSPGWPMNRSRNKP